MDGVRPGGDIALMAALLERFERMEAHNAQRELIDQERDPRVAIRDEERDAHQVLHDAERDARDAARRLENLQRMEAREAARDEREERMRFDLAIQRLSSRSLVSALKSGGTSAAFSALKIILKFGGKEVAFQVGRVASIQMAKGASKTAAKIIPFVSLAVGVGLGTWRIWKWWKTGDRSEIAKALVEVASGAIACIPGAGLIASGIIDIGLALADIGQCIYESRDVITTRNCDVQTAYETLGLAVAPGAPLPTQEEVNTAHRRIVLQLHPDRIAAAPPHIRERMAEWASLVNVCKDFIYTERGWRDA